MGEMAAVFKMTFANIQSMKYIRLYIIQREIRPGNGWGNFHIFTYSLHPGVDASTYKELY